MARSHLAASANQYRHKPAVLMRSIGPSKKHTSREEPDRTQAKSAESWCYALTCCEVGVSVTTRICQELQRPLSGIEIFIMKLRSPARARIPALKTTRSASPLEPCTA